MHVVRMYCKWEREQTTLILTVHSLVQCFLVHMARVWGYWSIESLLCFFPGRQTAQESGVFGEERKSVPGYVLCNLVVTPSHLQFLIACINIQYCKQSKLEVGGAWE